MITCAKLLVIVLRKAKLLAVLPVFLIYCLVPSVTLSKYFSTGVFEASTMFICLSQMLFPLCSILWPMGYLHIWVEGDICEALRAHSVHHKSCSGEMLLLFVIYLLLMLPVVLFATVLYQVIWLEYVRLVIQTTIVMCCFYFLSMLFKNVTIGAIPVISYLFLCFCISDSADLSVLSILEPFKSAEESNWFNLIFIEVVSVLLFCLGHLLDRFWKMYK